MGNQGISSQNSFSSLFLFLAPKNNPEPNSKKSNEILAWKHFFLVHFNGLSVRIQFCQQVSMAPYNSFPWYEMSILKSDCIG